MQSNIKVNTYVISLDYSQHIHHTEASASTCLGIRVDRAEAKDHRDIKSLILW